MKRTKTTLSLATARLDDNFDGFNIDTDTDAYRLFGGIQFGDTFGVEAGYLNFGDFTESVDLGGLLSRTDITGDNFHLSELSEPCNTAGQRGQRSARRVSLIGF